MRERERRKRQVFFAYPDFRQALRRLSAPREEGDGCVTIEKEAAQGGRELPRKTKGVGVCERPSNNLEGLVDGDGELVGVACQAERVARDEANGRVMLKEGYL